jgi:osmotically-inducible protein OsmY
MSRTGTALLAVVFVTASWYACQNTWRGLRQDTVENVALVQQKAQEKDLGGTAQAVADEAREVASAAREGIQDAVDRVRGTDEAPAANAPAPQGEKDRSARREAEEAAGKVGAFAREAGSEIASEARGATVHLDVKQALFREKALDSSNINVDVDDETRTVVLKGSVPTAPQRALAERVAQAHRRGFAVRNELRVGD